jgi:hypothetical protein
VSHSPATGQLPARAPAGTCTQNSYGLESNPLKPSAGSSHCCAPAREQRCTTSLEPRTGLPFGACLAVARHLPSNSMVPLGSAVNPW